MSQQDNPNKEKFDKRIMRPIAVSDKKTGKSYTLQQSETFNVNSKKIYFTKPNNITLFVSISLKQLNEAKDIYKDFILEKLKDKAPIEFKEEENSKLYDYFELIQMSIISIYTAIEGLANVAIPTDFVLEKINSKKVKELWSKENIERWISTSEKLGDIIPKILNIESPKKGVGWSKFKKLEEIRNDIVHQKTTEDPTKTDTLFLRKLLNKDVFKIVESGFAMIKFFCDHSPSNTLFPFGFSKVKIETVELDNMEEYFELVEDVPEKNK